MKGCFTTLLLAMVAALIVAFFGRSCHHQRIEDVLDQRVAARIKTMYPGINVKYDHLTAIVTGQATTSEVEQIKEKVMELAEGNGRVHFEVSPPGQVTPKIEMPGFTIFRDKDKITLNGTVDSAQTKAILGDVAKSKVGNLEVDNQLMIGKNTAPFSDFGNIVAAVPELIRASKNGRIEADPKKVVVSGIVESDEEKANLMSLFSSEKWNTEVVDQIEVRSVPRTVPSHFTIHRDNNKLTLTGNVDSPETRFSIGKVAQKDGLTIDNQISVGNQVMELPELSGVLAGIPMLIISAQNGKIDVTPGEVTLSGLVANRDTKGGIMDFYSADKMKGLKIVDQIKVKPSIPAEFTLAKENNKLTLTGTVDSPRTRDMLGNAARMDGLTVDNQIKVNEEVMAFPEFNSAISGIPSLIKLTRNWKIDFNPKGIVMAGEVNDQAAKEEIAKNFGANWKGPKFNDQTQVRPEPTTPPTFTVQRNKDKVTLTGTVDSPDTKTMLGNAAKVNGVTIDNQIKVSEEVMAFSSINGAVAGIPSLIGAAENAKIDVTPQKVTLSGLVNEKGDKDVVMGKFPAADWKGMEFEDKISIRPPKISPTFTWKQDDPKKAVLSGRVPDAKVRDSLVAAAKKRLGPDAEVIDQIIIDENVKNEPWLTALPVFASQAMPKVEMPVININDKVSTISGKVPNSTVMNDVNLAFSGINPPGHLDLQLEVVKPTAPIPPAMTERTVVPDVEVTGVGQRLTVSGKVPDKKTLDSIVNTILGVTDIDHLDKKLKIGDDVKAETYLEPLPDFIGKFYSGPVKNREFSLRNKELTLKGVLPSREEKDITLALADPLKAQGVKIIDLLTVVEPPKMAMNPPSPPKEGKDPAPTIGNKGDKPPLVDPETGELHSIYFGTGEFHIRDSQKSRSRKLLERARETTGKIVIDGFADERGTTELNDFLSDQRAQRIRGYLIKNGIDQSRIVSVVGRGEVPDGTSYQEYRRTDVRIIK